MLKVQQVIDRLAVFGIQFLGRRKMTGYRPLVFQFPHHEGIVYSYDKQWWIGRWEVYGLGNDDPYIWKKVDKTANISLSVSCPNLIENHVSITITKTINDSLVENTAKLEASFNIKDNELEGMAFLFCQGDVPVGVLLDRLREKTTFVTFI